MRLYYRSWCASVLVAMGLGGAFGHLIRGAWASHVLVDDTARPALIYDMRPLDIQPIGEELAIKWEDGTETFMPLEKLRRHCPCAGCKGEMDIMGNVYKGPDKPLPLTAFNLLRVANVGSYAIQPIWGDGHATGIYSFDYLRKVADAS